MLSRVERVCGSTDVAAINPQLSARLFARLTAHHHTCRATIRRSACARRCLGLRPATMQTGLTASLMRSWGPKTTRPPSGQTL